MSGLVVSGLLVVGLVVGQTPARAQVVPLAPPVTVPTALYDGGAIVAGACVAVSACRGAWNKADDVVRCLFFSLLKCDLPWGNRPDQPANSDVGDGAQASLDLSSASGATNIGASYALTMSTSVSGAGHARVNGRRNGGTGTGGPRTAGFYCSGGSHAGQLLTVLSANTESFAQVAEVDFTGCTTFGQAFLSFSSYGIGWTASPTGGPLTADTNNAVTGITVGKTDVSRTAQPYVRCMNAAGAVVYVAAAALAFTEGTARPSVGIPTCPDAYAYRVGGGVVSGNPWTPGQVISTTGSAGTSSAAPAAPPGTVPLAPPYREPVPDTSAPPGPANYPLAPQPLAAPSWSPAVAPTVVPIATPGAAAAPSTEPYPCVWGGYSLPASDCTNSPTPRPTPPPSAAPTVPPNVHVVGDPAPADTDGCLSQSISFNPLTWVLAPVKCALRWAFVPSDSTMARLDTLRSTMAARPPVSVVADSVGFGNGALSGAQGSGCWRLGANLGPHLGGQTSLLDSCGGSVEQKVKALRPLLEALMYLGICLPLAWWAWQTYAPGAQGVA